MSGAGVELQLAEIARALEAADEVPARVQRVLELTRGMVPYARCAVRCEAGPAPALTVTPAPGPAELLVVRGRLDRLLAMMNEGRAAGPKSLSSATMAVPITGLDRVIGVLAVDPEPDAPFDAQHLRCLSVVAAQLGAYFTMLKLRDDEAAAARALAQAHDFQQLLVGIVSHDLRNPLSVITVGATNLLRKHPDPLLRRTLERTLRCAKKANRIISDLLDVTSARINGGLGVTRSRTSLNALLAELADEARVAHPGVTIALELPGENVSGEWDGDRLSQAVSNLLNNAVQHGDEGAPITVTLSADPDSATVAVTNLGERISDELLEVMFDPFKQGAQVRRKAGGGLGLGLYIVRQIAEAHGGKVECRSTEHEGTTFVLTLPKVPRPTLDAAPVLVVDDDLDVRSSIVEVLEAHGYRVATAPNGARALEELKKGLRPRVVLVDLHMPVMDGATLLSLCQEDPRLRNIPLVVVSSDRVAGSRLTRAGAADFVPKPVRLETLLEKVEQLAYVRARAS